MGLLAGAASVGKLINPLIEKDLSQLNLQYSGISADQLATDEDFWHQIKLAYTVSPQILNLNNGGVSPQPKVVQEAVELYNRLSNQAPSLYMWRTLDRGREPLRNALAKLAGCSEEEIAINRNSSEALETIIFGLPLNKGDEVILTKQDYPNMINAWKQRELRDGIVLKWLDFEFPIEDDDQIVRKVCRGNDFKDPAGTRHTYHQLDGSDTACPKNCRCGTCPGALKFYWMLHIVLLISSIIFLNWIVIILVHPSINGFVHLLAAGCCMSKRIRSQKSTRSWQLLMPSVMTSGNLNIWAPDHLR